MSNLMVLGIVMGVVSGVVVTTLVVLPGLKKKGVQVDKVLKNVDTVLDGADGFIAVAEKLAPNNPAINILKLVERYAHIGVNQAEQLCLTSNLKADERNAKARETIYAALKLLNIEKTSEIDKIIDGAIEAEVLALGHKDKTAQGMQLEKDMLQEQNKQLKEALVQIQGTVNSIE